MRTAATNTQSGAAGWAALLCTAICARFVSQDALNWAGTNVWQPKLARGEPTNMMTNNSMAQKVYSENELAKRRIGANYTRSGHFLTTSALVKMQDYTLCEHVSNALASGDFNLSVHLSRMYLTSAWPPE